MNPIAQTEKYKFWIIGCVVLVCLYSLMLSSFRGPMSADAFWHLQMGKDWIENGLSPWVDNYSFTHADHEIALPPVVFQALLHWTVSWTDTLTGFSIYIFACFTLVLGLTILLLRQLRAPAIIYALVIPSIAYLLQVRAMARPELIGYLFTILILIFYFRDENRITTSNMLATALLILMWTNYHSSIVGYVILFGFFLDSGIHLANVRAPASTWKKWLGWGLLILAVGFLNPKFSHPLIGAASFSSDWKSIINEYLPTTGILKSYSGLYVLLPIAFLTPILAFSQKRFGLLVIWIVLFHSAFSMRRMVTPAGIVIVLMFAYLLTNSGLLERLNQAKSGHGGKVLGLVSLAFVMGILYLNVEQSHRYLQEYPNASSHFPIEMPDYMLARGYSGNIFNSMGIGGYLIHRLSPQMKVYIDGRTNILYPKEHYLKNLELTTTTSSKLLWEELEKYSVDFIIWPHTQTRHDLVQEMGGFGLDFVGPRFTLYKRGESNFPLFGMLLTKPECWRPDMQAQLILERSRMDQYLPDNSGILSFANLVMGYTDAANGKAFLEKAISKGKWNDLMRRFAAYRLLEEGYYDLAPKLLGGISALKPGDFLAAVFAKFKGGDYNTGSRILADFANTDWPVVKDEDRYLQYKLYLALEEQRELSSSEQIIADGLKMKFASTKNLNPGLNHKFESNKFCAYPDNQVLE